MSTSNPEFWKLCEQAKKLLDYSDPTEEQEDELDNVLGSIKNTIVQEQKLREEVKRKLHDPKCDPERDFSPEEMKILDQLIKINLK